MKKLSIVIPVFNEKENLISLYKEITEMGEKLVFPYEIIFVNDGSVDDSGKVLDNLAQNDKRIKILTFIKNFGQTAAFDAGIKNTTGDVIATLDSDLQNDPQDIRRMIMKLEEGYDVVCGWRIKRQDPVEKRIFSLFANKLRRMMTKESIHDSGCSLRVYKKEVFEGLDLYGEMHRFIPALLSLKGFSLTELHVNHRARSSGRSKYNNTRLLKGIFDLLFIMFMMRFSTRPIHIFGMMGALTFLLGLIIAVYLSYIKIIFGVALSNRPLLILSVLMMILGTQFLIFGILAEILIRIYFKTHQITPYTFKK